MIEPPYVIKFFAEEDCMGVERHQLFEGYSGESAMSCSEARRWIRDIKGVELTSERFRTRKALQMKGFPS
jgi:hypothetical protein